MYRSKQDAMEAVRVLDMDTVWKISSPSVDSQWSRLVQL